LVFMIPESILAGIVWLLMWLLGEQPHAQLRLLVLALLEVRCVQRNYAQMLISMFEGVVTSKN